MIVKCFRCGKEIDDSKVVKAMHRKAGEVHICMDCDFEMTCNAFEGVG